MRKCFLSLCVFPMSLVFAMSGCKLLQKEPQRETILDKIVSIPEEIIYDVPYLPPHCEEIAVEKKGFADIKGGSLYYEEEGHGIPVVLISGGPGETHHIFHPYFSRIKDIARVIYYDQRGTGWSSKDYTGKTYTVKQSVEDLESLRKHLNIDRWVVLGWSYGGTIAQCYALTYPNRCLGLVLGVSDTGILKYSERNEREKEFISQEELDAIKNLSEKFYKQKLTPAQFGYNMGLSGFWKYNCYHKPTKEELIRTALYYFHVSPNFEQLMRSDPSKIRLKDKFDDFEIPTLIVEGKYDLGWWDPNRPEILRKNHPHAEVVIFEKSGHKVFADETDKFFKSLRDFLRKSDKASIVYKPGNRLEWPKPPRSSDLWKMAMDAMYFIKDKEEKKKVALELYEQALRDNVEYPHVWQPIAESFILTRSNLDKCLIALQQLEASLKKTVSKIWKGFDYCVITWQGHLLDLQGKRDEAVKRYEKALAVQPHGYGSNAFLPSILVDRKWIKDRLKTPFEWGMENKLHKD